MKLVNKTGYLKGAKTAKNPVNIIPSNLITTQGMAFPIKANGKTLYPNTGQYKFPTSHVVETPLKQKGVNKLEGDLISKVIMNRNKDKDFVQRAFAVGKNPKSLMFTRIDNSEEPPYQTKETHRMGWGEDDKGQAYMYPTIMNPNNEEVKVPKQYADYISKEGYKKATGMSYQKGTKSTKANPIPTPSLGSGIVKGIQNTINTPAFKQQIKKEKEEKKLKLINNRKKAYTPSPGNVGMTAGPIDAAIAGVAGIPGLVGRGLTTALPYVQGALNAPLTTAVPGVTAGNILSSVGAADAIVNRIPQIPEQLKNKEYSAAAGNALMAGLDILGAKYGATNTVKEGKSLYDVNKVIPKPTSLINKTKNTANNNIPNIHVSLASEDVPLVEKSARFISQKGKQIINEIGTDEGIKRLKNQFKKASPSLNDEQLDYLVLRRLNEMRTAVDKNKPNFLLKYGQGATGTPTQGQLEDLYPIDNAHWAYDNPHPEVFEVSAPRYLFPSQQHPSQTFSTINLQKTHGYDVFTDPNYKPGSVTLGKNLEENLMVLDHEIGGHGLQKGGEMPIDEDLRKLLPQNASYKKDPSGATRITDNRSWLERKLNPLDHESFTDKMYFDNSGGRYYRNEPFAFLVEQRRKMIERGILNDRYDKVTPWKLFQTRMAAAKNTNRNFMEGDRLIKFTPPWKYKKLAEIMNEAPAVLPGAVGTGALGAAAASEEKKNGVKTLKYKEGSKGVSLAFSRGEKDPKGGLTQKGVNKYNRATGGNLKMAVTTPPSKLKAGSKAANRRKSFCARMSGVKGPMAKNGKPTRKALALRKWNC